jgi:radical SAM superfamily enzyme with C-terminal helix-hairpin-helix motif
MPIVHCEEAIFDEHAQVLHTAIDGSECDRIVARIKKLVRRLINRAAQCLRQYPNYPNLVVDLEHQALQRVMLVAQ